MISLGQASNYSAGQVWRHLFAWGTKRDFEFLRTKLAERYGAKKENVALYHTGRSALTVALQNVARSDKTKVIIPGLTCIAVVRAVKAAGCEPVFVDLAKDSLEYDYDQLDQELSLQSRDTIILIQNTLGVTWNARQLETIAKKYHAHLVEDLAHSAGRLYADGREAGTIGEATALSFGKGKAIDTICGGAVILRNNQKVQQPQNKPKFSDRARDRWYPFFGMISRWWWKLGRIFMGGLVKIHFVQRSADAELDTSKRLTYWQAKLALKQLDSLPKTPLRIYKLIQNRPKALQELSKHGYNFDEIWYNVPVSPERYAKEAKFPTKKCPETVKIAQEIINFPTWYPAKKITTAYEIVKEYETK